MLLDSHPGHESLMVLPDYPRYRDLAIRTRTGRHAAAVHVVFLNADGTFSLLFERIVSRAEHPE